MAERKTVGKVEDRGAKGFGIAIGAVFSGDGNADGLEKGSQKVVPGSVRESIFIRQADQSRRAIGFAANANSGAVAVIVIAVVVVIVIAVVVVAPAIAAVVVDFGGGEKMVDNAMKPTLGGSPLRCTKFLAYRRKVEEHLRDLGVGRLDNISYRQNWREITEDGVTIFVEERRPLGLLDQRAVRHELQERILVDFVFEADSVAHLLADFDVHHKHNAVDGYTGLGYIGRDDDASFEIWGLGVVNCVLLAPRKAQVQGQDFHISVALSDLVRQHLNINFTRHKDKNIALWLVPTNDHLAVSVSRFDIIGRYWETVSLQVDMVGLGIPSKVTHELRRIQEVATGKLFHWRGIRGRLGPGIPKSKLDPSERQLLQKCGQYPVSNRPPNLPYPRHLHFGILSGVFCTIGQRVG
ncbi:hypothetical protein NPX13_g11071 [Xylaria arbuscula]|uniref:Uncharacterized protein n=1 Tax=Xylaria arbuscula TaxID=114810 RepID=A0A9W8N3V1_9PEZI|nr:hypothetical protein NPX13_g11071 [Xylaria arbuscula]